MSSIHKKMENAEQIRSLSPVCPDSPNNMRRAPAMILSPIVESTSPLSPRRTPLGPLHHLSYLQQSTFRPPLPLPPSQRGLRRHRPAPPPPPPTSNHKSKFCGYAILVFFVIIPLAIANYYLYNYSYSIFVSLLPAQIMSLTAGGILAAFVYKADKTDEPPNCEEVSIT